MVNWFISFDDLQVCHGTGSQMSSEGVYEKSIAKVIRRNHVDKVVKVERITSRRLHSHPVWAGEPHNIAKTAKAFPQEMEVT